MAESSTQLAELLALSATRLPSTARSTGGGGRPAGSTATSCAGSSISSRTRASRGSWFYARWVRGERFGSDPAFFTEKWRDYLRFAAEEHERLGLTSWVSQWTLLHLEQDELLEQREHDPSLWGRRLGLVQRDCRPGVSVKLPADGEILDVAAYRREGDGLDHGSRTPLPVRDGTVRWTAPGDGWVVTVVTATPWARPAGCWTGRRCPACWDRSGCCSGPGRP